VPPISAATDHYFLCTDHFQAPSKIKQCSKSFKFWCRIKSIAIDFSFFIRPQNLKPLQDDPNSETKDKASERKLIARY
jgi:hypothetical protein